ncbi:MAG: RHS repeat-associated core domain-containing protein, partial [Bryobacteraceae bacterium]|nr:RHS repeat-associated core domain-containing protein [Bryobacteraceae bacterium]
RTVGLKYGAGVDPALRFTGKERDAETGLDYFGARYYSGTQGRFTSVDPAMESALLEDPQTWNRYSYVYNRPLTLVDPDGRAPQLVTVPGGALIGFELGFAGYAIAQRLSGGEFRMRDALAAGAGGAVSGGLAGATFGTSLVAGAVGTVLVGAGANAAGGLVARSVDSDEAGTDPFAGEEVFADAFTGGFSTLVGVTVGGTYRMLNRIK